MHLALLALTEDALRAASADTESAHAHAKFFFRASLLAGITGFSHGPNIPRVADTVKAGSCYNLVLPAFVRESFRQG